MKEPHFAIGTDLCICAAEVLRGNLQFLAVEGAEKGAEMIYDLHCIADRRGEAPQHGLRFDRVGR